MKTILVVEDEMKIARVVRDHLVRAGFEVIVVGDGEAALASARAQRPDLVVLDLGLPGMDGLDVARSPREIRRLGRSFNEMTERLRTNEERRRTSWPT